MTERLTRVDANTINYTVTIDGREGVPKPWTVSLPLNRDDTYQMFRVLRVRRGTTRWPTRSATAASATPKRRQGARSS